jgi:hypothetical protein
MIKRAFTFGPPTFAVAVEQERKEAREAHLARLGRDEVAIVPDRITVAIGREINRDLCKTATGRRGACACALMSFMS